MYRRLLVLSVVVSCLIVIMAAGAGLWGIRQGLIQGPTGRVQLGQFEVMAFSGIEYSTMQAPRGYYAIWVAVARDPAPSSRPWRPLRWAHRLLRLDVPPPAVVMQ